MRAYLMLATLALGSPAAPQSSGPQITLNAAEEPETKAWTQPALFSFNSRAKAKDYWALDAALKVEFQPVSTSSANMFVRGTVNRSSESGKEAANYSGKVGLKFDFTTARLAPDAPAPDRNALYFLGDATIGLNHKRIYKDPKADCTQVPLPAACGSQAETSLRSTFALMPFHTGMEATFYQNPDTGKLAGPALTHSVSPIITVFTDAILDAKVDASGLKPKGSVTGTKFELKGAVSPRFTAYRLILSGGLQHVQALQRSDRRRQGFDRSSTLFSLAADYELGPRSFEKTGGFIPAFGVSYTKGNDPLAAKKDLDTIFIGIKLTYKPPS